MKFQKITMLAIVCAGLISCNDTSSGTQLTGTVDSGDKVIISRLEPNRIVPVDTLTLENGKFSISLDIDTADFFVVDTDDKYRIPLFIQPNEQVSLEVSKGEKGQQYEVSGSDESEKIRAISKLIEGSMARIDSLNVVNQSAQGQPDYLQVKSSLDTVFESIVESAKSELKGFIDDEPGSIANLFVFSQRIGNFQLLVPEEDMDYFNKVETGINETYAGNKHAINFSQRMNQVRLEVQRAQQMEEIRRNVGAGKEVPEIEMTDPNGKVRKLSDLRGKVVLVDFWASWCRPCRAENPNLVRMYNEYKGNGFDVFSVSLDGLPQQQNPKQQWEQAILQDGLAWDNHVSELKGWNGISGPMFGFNGIPYTVLVDRDGKIIQTNLRGPALEAKLKEVLDQS